MYSTKQQAAIDIFARLFRYFLYACLIGCSALKLILQVSGHVLSALWYTVDALGSHLTSVLEDDTDANTSDQIHEPGPIPSREGTARVRRFNPQGSGLTPESSGNPRYTVSKEGLDHDSPVDKGLR